MKLIAILCALAACQATPSPLETATAAPARKPPPPMPVMGGIAPVEADFTLRDFHFAAGGQLDELRLHYTTYGTPVRDAAGHVTNAVLILHGTTGAGSQFTWPQFAGELFGTGQPLDLARFYVILPDDIGHGRSSKPSDGLHARFPHYGYNDMVAAEHALVVDGLHVDHLRVVMGTSMGCMHTWMWLERWPDTIDAGLPLACLPTEIAGRNRAWRRMLVNAIRDDPAYAGGEYVAQPRAGMTTAAALFEMASSAPLVDQQRMPTRDEADRAVEHDVERFITGHDANDVLYQVASSGDYDPSRDLDKITARVTFINSADDFINPPELGIAEKLIERVPHGKFVLIPISDKTRGHGTHSLAALWKDELVELLDPTTHHHTHDLDNPF